MAKKTLTATLSVSSIKALQKELEKYRNSLTYKCELFVKRLAEAGIPVIDDNMAKASFIVDKKGIQSGADPQHYTQIKINTFGNYARADLIVEGKELLFIEFGAGVFYNDSAGTSPHPKGQEFGYVIGSYGKGHGVQKVWGYYADSGELILSSLTFIIAFSFVRSAISLIRSSVLCSVSFVSVLLFPFNPM